MDGAALARLEYHLTEALAVVKTLREEHEKRNASGAGPNRSEQPYPANRTLTSEIRSLLDGEAGRAPATIPPNGAEQAPPSAQDEDAPPDHESTVRELNLLLSGFEYPGAEDTPSPQSSASSYAESCSYDPRTPSSSPLTISDDDDLWDYEACRHDNPTSPPRSPKNRSTSSSYHPSSPRRSRPPPHDSDDLPDYEAYEAYELYDPEHPPFSPTQRLTSDSPPYNPSPTPNSADLLDHSAYGPPFTPPQPRPRYGHYGRPRSESLFLPLEANDPAGPLLASIEFDPLPRLAGGAAPPDEDGDDEGERPGSS